MAMTTEDVSPAARGGLRSLTFRVLAATSDFLVLLVTTRGFGAEGRGLYALTSLALTSAGMVLGGPSVVMRRELGRKRAPLGRLFAASLVYAGGVLALALVVLVPLMAAWETHSILLYASIAIAPMLLTEFQISLYQALGDMRRMHYVWLARSVVPLTALTVVALAAPGQIHLALLVWACVQFVVPTVTLTVQQRQTGLEFRHLKPLLARVIRRGMPVSVGNGITMLSYRLDVIVVAALVGVAAAGRYSVATAAGETLLLLSRAVLTGAYAPMITSDIGESVRVTVRMIRHCIALVVPAGLLLTVIARVAVGRVFGGGFADVWVLVGLLVPSFLALSITEVLVGFLVVRLERTREFLLMSSAASAGNLVGAAGLVTLLGVAGAAISSSIFSTLSALYLLVRLVRAGGPTNPLAYLPGRAELQDYRRLLGAARPQRLRPSGGHR